MDSNIGEKTVFRGAGESHGDQDEICRYEEVRALYFLHFERFAQDVGLPFDKCDIRAYDFSILTLEGLGQDTPMPFTPFPVAARSPEDVGPVRPGRVVWPVFRRFWKYLDLRDGGGLLPGGCSYAVRTCVASTYYQHFFPCRKNVFFPYVFARNSHILLSEEIHGEMNAVKVSPGNIEISRFSRAAGETYHVKPVSEEFR